MSGSFRNDSQIAEIAEAYALDAIDAAMDNFQITLSFSEDSIREVETILSRLHDQLPVVRPPADTIWTFAKMFGSYIGEVLRRHHGGAWGIVTLDNQEFPGIQLSDRSLCWPWSRAHKRITTGPEDNVWHYYVSLTQPINHS